MALASVSREEFKIRSDLEVLHIPTGAVFRAYPYSNPDDMLQSVKVTWGLRFGTRITTSVVFASMHIYHVAGGTPVAAILRPARTPKGSEVCTVIKHVTRRLRRHWPKTRLVWRGDSHYGRVEAMDWAEEHGADYIFGLAGNAALDALVAETAVNLRFYHAMSSNPPAPAPPRLLLSWPSKPPAEWLAAILGREGVAVTPDAKEHVWSALSSLASAPLNERTLTGFAVLLQSGARAAAT